MKILLSSILVLALLGILLLPSASAVPVSYNGTTITLPYTTTLRNSSAYDVFLNNNGGIGAEYKLNNNTVDVYSTNIGTITYNTNLKAIWKLENTLTDSKNSYVLNKIAGTTTYVTGMEGNALSFDGSTYFNGTSLATVRGTGDRSVSFWVYDTDTSVRRTLFGWGQTGDRQNFALEVLAGGQLVYIDGHIPSPIVGATISQNTWYHIVLTLGSVGTSVSLYENGVLDTTAVTADNTSYSTLLIGQDTGTPQNNFKGIIDEFRIYGSTLTSDQVKALYMVGKYNQSHEFDGGESISYGNVFNFDRTDPFSVSFWLKTTLSVSGNVFVSHFNTNIGWFIDENSNHVRFEMEDNGGRVTEVKGSTVINDGIWHHVVVENNGVGNGGGISIWVDKNPETLSITQNAVNSTIQTSTNLVLGSTNSGNPLTGQLDDVYLMNFDLTQTQINSIYTGEGYTVQSAIPTVTSSWYHTISGKSTISKILGTGLTNITLACGLTSAGGGATGADTIQGNSSFLYYTCGSGAGPYPLYKTNINTGYNQPLLHIPNVGGGYTRMDVLVGKKDIFAITYQSATTSEMSSITTGNFSVAGSGALILTNQKFSNSNQMYKYYYNGTSTVASAGSNCEILYQPTNATRTVDNIVCDKAFPPMSVRYWQGMLVQGQGLYYTNSTQKFLNSIDANTYKHLLSLPCTILGVNTPCVTMILQDGSGVNWFIAMDSTKIYYNKADTLNNLINQNRAWQSYDMINTLTDSTFGVIPTNSLSFNLYGFSTNTTVGPRTGLFSIPSGYHFKSMTSQSAIRDIDPQWTNGATDLPVIFTSNTIFPVYLTVSNAPTDSALMATNGGQVINSQEAIYAVSRLDGTRSVELDLPPAACVNTYVADISVAPTIWNYEGQICATGANTKTIAYASTLPLSFYTLKYGASSSYNPTNNGLTTSVRSATTPLTYTVTIKNSTGAVTQTYTTTVNATLDTHVFNVTNASKPASVYVTMPGGSQIYSSYLGSPLSLASTASFFHQYLSYQGFDLLSFIPIVFASMFTRNTVGVGMALTVVVIASLSWLSVVVIPDTTVYVAIVVACIGIVGYRSFGL
jgi:hypothetical protein